jgi:hypothetical protein
MEITEMSLNKLNNLIGAWTGDNVLRLSWMNRQSFIRQAI